MTSLLDRAKHALVWNAAFNIFRDILGLIVMLVLVRLLKPEQYGQFALVTAIIGFISVFAHQNFLAHTLQVRDDSNVHYQDHFTAGGPIQITMFAITNVVALGMRYFDDYAGIAILVHAMSIGFLLEWPCELRLKMLERSLNWRRLRLLHAIGLVASSAVAIAVGFLGAGVYALLLPGLLVTLPFIFDLFFLQKWRPTWQWDRERYMPSFKFGLTLLTSGLVARSRRLIETGAVVVILGYSSAGLLERAVSLGLMFCQRVATQLMYTLYPVVTRLEPGTEDYRRASRIVLRGVSWFTVPVATVLALSAAPFVHLVYGGNWDDVIPLVPIAVMVGGVAAVFYVIYMLLLGHNEERRCMAADFIDLIGTLVALVFLLREGLLAYLIGLLVVRVLVLFCGVFWLLSCGGIDRKELSNALFPGFVSGALAYVACEGLVTMADWSLRNPIDALWYALCFGFLYIMSLRIFFTKLLAELVSYLPANRTIGRLLFFAPHPG